MRKMSLRCQRHDDQTKIRIQISDLQTQWLLPAVYSLLSMENVISFYNIQNKKMKEYNLHSSEQLQLQTIEMDSG